MSDKTKPTADVNTILVINPITKTIAPKHRNQKTVFIARRDHNSVLFRFEIPRYVDGYDMAAEENAIHIHYANLDAKDTTKHSEGFSDAANITIETDQATNEEIVAFYWTVPNKATRYAGVASIGITFERYDYIDEKLQEIYSWSTAPYGNIAVLDSMDNTAAVAEKERNYLVDTCNAICSTILKLAESWARGGTGERAGEDTDNAMYYAQRAKASAQEAEDLKKEIWGKVNIGVHYIPSVGLEIENGVVVGIGTCTDEHIAVPEFDENGNAVISVASNVFGSLLGNNGGFIKSIAFPPSILNLKYSVVDTSYCPNLETVCIMNPNVECPDGFSFYLHENVKNIYFGGSRKNWIELNQTYSMISLRTENIEAGIVPTVHYSCFASWSETEKIENQLSKLVALDLPNVIKPLTEAVGRLDERVAKLETDMGDFEAALDATIALCDNYIGGEGE